MMHAHGSKIFGNQSFFPSRILIPIHFAKSKAIPNEIRPGVLINVKGFNPIPITPLVLDQLPLK